MSLCGGETYRFNPRGTPVCRLGKKEINIHAVTSDFNDFSRGGRSALADQSFHPDGGNDQINLERSGGDLRGSMAPERLWPISQFLPPSHRDVRNQERGREVTAGTFLSEFAKEGANNAWNNIGGDFDSRARGSATTVVA
jgi:hypothetical protein